MASLFSITYTVSCKRCWRSPLIVAPGVSNRLHYTIRQVACFWPFTCYCLPVVCHYYYGDRLWTIYRNLKSEWTGIMKRHFSYLLPHTDSNFIEVFETRNKFLGDSVASEERKKILIPLIIQTSYISKNVTYKLFRLSQDIHQKGIWPIIMKLRARCLHVVLPYQTGSSKISCRGKLDHHPIVLKVI